MTCKCEPHADVCTEPHGHPLMMKLTRADPRLFVDMESRALTLDFTSKWGKMNHSGTALNHTAAWGRDSYTHLITFPFATTIFSWNNFHTSPGSGSLVWKVVWDEAQTSDLWSSWKWWTGTRFKCNYLLSAVHDGYHGWFNVSRYFPLLSVVIFRKGLL